MSIYFISDLHLDANTPKATACFLHFLTQQAITADALYILGDLFEFWIGDDNNSDLAQQIRTALKTLTSSNVPVYFINGNRDFLIGKKFAAQTGITILPDPCMINVYGKPTLIMHGDLLCTDDQQYQRFRRIAHNPLLQRLFLLLPMRWREKIAATARQKSQQHTQNTDLRIQDVNPHAVTQTMVNHSVNQLIHGHTHRPAIHNIDINNNPAKRIVLNAWHEQGGGLRITNHNNVEMFTLSFT